MSKDRFFSGGGQSEIDDIEGHFIDLSFTFHTDVPTTIVENWNSFPKGKPFTGTVFASGTHSVQGYIYPNGNYGSIFIHSFVQNRIWVVRCNGGTFIKGYLDLNVLS